eukprot:scaffold33224_cov129-Isochrysis_galbana.AAC.2
MMSWACRHSRHWPDGSSAPWHSADGGEDGGKSSGGAAGGVGAPGVGGVSVHALVHSDDTSKKRMLLFVASHAAIALRTDRRIASQAKRSGIGSEPFSRVSSGTKRSNPTDSSHTPGASAHAMYARLPSAAGAMDHRPMAVSAASTSAESSYPTAQPFALSSAATSSSSPPWTRGMDASK